MKCQNCGTEINISAGETAEYKPISMWGYLGYEILFSLPVIGIICLIIFALTAKNKNVKNFARSYFCIFIIAIVLAIVIGVLGGVAGISLREFTKSSVA